MHNNYKQVLNFNNTKLDYYLDDNLCYHVKVDVKLVNNYVSVFIKEKNEHHFD